MKFSIKSFFRKCDRIRRKLRIWSQLLKKTLKENFIFCTVTSYGNSSVNSYLQFYISNNHVQFDLLWKKRLER